MKCSAEDWAGKPLEMTTNTKSATLTSTCCGGGDGARALNVDQPLDLRWVAGTAASNIERVDIVVTNSFRNHETRDGREG